MGGADEGIRTDAGKGGGPEGGCMELGVSAGMVISEVRATGNKG